MPPKKCAALDKKKDDDDGVEEREDGDARVSASDRGGGGGPVAVAVVAEKWGGGERSGGLDIRAEMEEAVRGEKDRVGGEVGRWAGAEPAAIGDVGVGVDEGEAAPSAAFLAFSSAAIVAERVGAAYSAAFVVEAVSEGEAAPRLASRRDSRMRAIAGGGGEDANRVAATFGGGDETGSGGGEETRDRGVVVVDGVLFPEMPGLDGPAAFFWA